MTLFEETVSSRTKIAYQFQVIASKNAGAVLQEIKKQQTKRSSYTFYYKQLPQQAKKDGRCHSSRHMCNEYILDDLDTVSILEAGSLRVFVLCFLYMCAHAVLVGPCRATPYVSLDNRFQNVEC